MPNRRPDSHHGYWISTHAGLSGWPKLGTSPSEPTAADYRSIGEDLAQRHKGQRVSFETRDLSEGERVADASPPAVARLVIRHLGFRYERIVGLADFVSRQDVADLLGVTIMSVSRWVRSKQLPSQMREVNGRKYSVVKVADVWRLAKELNLRVPEGRTLVVVGADDSGKHKRPHKRR